MFILEMQSRVPIYEQMKKKIVELVVLGILKPDEQLPSVRSLARELGVNPNTVQKAYQELEREGIVYSVSGKGSFICHFTQQSTAIYKQADAALRQSMNNARLAGLTQEAAQKLLDETYKEGTAQ